MSRNPQQDVVIVGGGVIGCAAALTLARRGLSVAILDRGQVGREASWAGAGILSPGNYSRRDPMSALIRASIARYASWTAELLSETGIDPEYMRSGRLSLLFDEQQEHSARAQIEVTREQPTDEDGPPPELLTAGAVHDVETAVTTHLLGALLCRTTAQVRNPRLLRALRAACLQRYVTLYEGVSACGLIWDKDRVAGVRTAAGDLPAGTIILAAGAWSAQVDPRIAPLAPVYPVRGQIVLLRQDPRPFNHILEYGKCYLVCRSDGHVIAGATEDHDSGFDKHTTVSGARDLLATASRMVPHLAPATVIQTWAGLRPGTPDRRPYIGPPPGVEGLLVATGHFRTGLTLAPITAEILTDLICDGRTEYDLSACRPERTATR